VSSAPANAVVGLVVCAGLLAVAFATTGGVDQTTAASGNTWTEIVLTLIGGAGLGAAVLIGTPGEPRWGTGPILAMTALTVLTALSILWSVVPDTSWTAADQMLAYLAVFAAAVAMARLFPQRWPALLGAVVLTAAALSVWALLAKVFPSTLAADNTYGRLQAPFGYWNAVGVTGAMGLPAALWAAARRERGRRLAALAVPAMTVMLAAVILSASRSADIVAAIGIAGWLVFAPVRLRSVAALAVAAAGAAAISIYALGTSALTTDNVAPATQDSAGHTFGIVLLVVVAIVCAAGWATARAMDRMSVAADVRRRAGIVLVGLACLIPVAAIGGLAASSRGLTGEISHAWTQLTSTNAAVPTDSAGRVFQFGSSRPQYWHQGLDVGSHAPLAGVGASGFGTARLRYTTSVFKADQAHGYVFETFADLGTIGLVVNAVLLVAWVAVARRPLAVGARWRGLDGSARGERAGMVALALIVLGFGVQSTLDFTWYFPGVTVPVLLAAGWLVGRGPLARPVGRRRDRPSPLDRPAAVSVAALLGAVALAGAWLQWQPLRSAQALDASQSAATNAAAFDDARSAISADPLAVQPRVALAQLDRGVGRIAAGRAELVRLTRAQPDNPQAFEQLGDYDAATGAHRAAIVAMERVLALDHTPDTMTHDAQVTIAAAQAALAKPPTS
jgi:hypothetical protein